MGRHARETRAERSPEDGLDSGGRPHPLSGWRRRWGIAVAVLGLIATVVAGLDLFAAQPRVDRFFASGTAKPPTAERTPSSASGRAAEPAGPPAPRPAPKTLVPPVPGRVLLGYGWAFSPTFDTWRFHAAVDLAAPPGQPVLAAAAGTVTAAHASRLFGDVVVLDVGGGESCTYEGLASLDVRPGEKVGAGQRLGVVGPSPVGEASEPPHVHWQVSRAGKPVDPEGLRLSTTATT